MDDNDAGAKVGLWVVLAIITLLLFGLIGGVAMRALHAKKPVAAAATPGDVMVVAQPVAGEPDPAAAAVLADTSATAPVPGTQPETPLSGESVGKLYFEVGSATLPANSAAGLVAAVKAAHDAPAKKLVLAGFHDPSGDAVQNAELAKQRALEVRQALINSGVDPARLVLRKPEQMALGGRPEEARRVEIRLVD